MSAMVFILVENDGLWRWLWGAVEISVKMKMRVDVSHRGAARLPAELSSNELISIQVRWTHSVQSLNCAIFTIVGAGEVGVRDPDRVLQPEPESGSTSPHLRSQETQSFPTRDVVYSIWTTLNAYDTITIALPLLLISRSRDCSIMRSN